MKKLTILSLLTVIVSSSCIKEDYFGKSSLNKILSFTLPQQLGASQINHDSLLIRVTVSEEIDITAIAPTVLTISNFAAISPGKDQVRDFSEPVVYTVIAEDGSAAGYTIYVETDAPEIQLPNSGFDQWYITNSDYYQIGAGPTDTIWCTGNEGVVTLGDANTLPILVNNDTVAQLTTLQLGALAQLVGQGMAAGSLFTGTFELNIANPPESPQFGTPFIARPNSFSVNFRYIPGDEMTNGFGDPIAGKDSLDMAVLLEDRSSLPWKRVATAWYRTDEATPEWTELKLPLIYGQLSDPAYYEIPANGVWGTGDEKPTHISVIFSSSARGAFFEGAPGSELLLNDFRLYYE
ncbi:MAG: PCMD domain-containing protein [Bacteroidales bacterium]|nr:PCMD domain-containing protein [Bacteroidales bacterium]